MLPAYPVRSRAQVRTKNGGKQDNLHIESPRVTISHGTVAISGDHHTQGRGSTSSRGIAGHLHSCTVSLQPFPYGCAHAAHMRWLSTPRVMSAGASHTFPTRPYCTHSELQGWGSESTARGVLEAPRTLLVVGPEGDFTAAEQAALVAAGGHLVGLGPLRLRSETAAVALLSAAMLHSSRLTATKGR